MPIEGSIRIPLVLDDAALYTRLDSIHRFEADIIHRAAAE